MTVRLACAVAAALVAAVTAAGCTSSSPSAANATRHGVAGPVVIGSANFAEDEVLAVIYAQALRGAGVKVATKLDIGPREEYYPMIKSGEISVMPEYNGALLGTSVDSSSKAKTSKDVDAALHEYLPASLEVLDPALDTTDADTVTVTQATAEKYNLHTIADLAPYAKNQFYAGPSSFNVRPYGIPGLNATYGLAFKFKQMDESGPETIAALLHGTVLAADVFSTSPEIATDHLKVLADPKHDFAAQNVIPLVYKKAATPTIVKTLNEVDAKLTTAELMQMDEAVSAEGAEYDAVATAFLKRAGIPAG